MSPSSDYRGEMSGGDLTHSNIERLLRRDDSAVSDEDLKRFIASLSAPEEPPRDVPAMATALAATARANRPGKTRSSFRRLAILASAGALVVALGGVALASDSAVPGDPLYGVDRALEAVGVGSGGVEERIVEFDALLANGRDYEAYELLAEVIEGEEDAASERAQHHLELAATKTNDSAESAQEKVAALQDFIEQNKGHGVGADGTDFGRGLADIVRSDDRGSSPEDANTVTEPADNAEPVEQPGNSGNAPGQQGSDTDADTQPAEQPGNSANAPGKQDESSEVDPAHPEGDTGERRGNSANAPGVQEDGAQPGPSEDGQGAQPGNSANAPGQQRGNGSGD